MDKIKLKELETDCMNLIQRKIELKLSKEEYYSELLLLDKKYLLPAHDPPLTSFQLANYYTIKQTIRDGSSGKDYTDHLYPWNFWEAGEMYIRRSQVKPQVKERPRYVDDLEDNF